MPKNHAKRLMLAVFIFVLLDISILAINYWITYQMSEDAVVINLAGRQRMLSQRVTKVLLQMSPENTTDQRKLLEQELHLSFNMFLTTLDGFAKGGTVTSGNGKPITINKLHNTNSQQLIQQTNLLLKEMIDPWVDYVKNNNSISNEIIDQFRLQAVTHNLSVLDLMNQLTFALEQDSQYRANLLRLIQTIIFLLALINFIIILRGMYQQTQQAMVMSEHFNTLAMHDALTGLSNRRHFNTQLTAQIEKYQITPENNHFALIMLDLDGFKPVNDTFGHEAGDEVLRIVSERLKNHARINDTVARFGGDEFALIVIGIESPEHINKLAHRLLNTIKQPIHLSSHHDVRVGASIGVALYPIENPTQHTITHIDDLIELADTAMYQAKRDGKGRVIFA